MSRLRSFWGFKILNFNIYFFYFLFFFGGGSEKWGYEDFVDILWGGGGHHKIGLYLGVISMHLSVIS